MDPDQKVEIKQLVSIKKDVCFRLAKTQVVADIDLEELKGSDKSEWLFSKQDSASYLNGVMLGNYLLALKRIMVSVRMCVYNTPFLIETKRELNSEHQS